MSEYPEAVTAAGNALRKHWQTDKPGIYSFSLDPMHWAAVAVEATAPLIEAAATAAERERIRQLATEHDAAITRDCECGPHRGGRFADLLEGDSP